MRCPTCDAFDSRVIDSRPAEGGTSIRRRRVCDACDARYTTYERLAQADVVRKRNGDREPFESHKVRRGLAAALTDRPVSEEAIEAMVDEIARAVRASSVPVESDTIGTMVLNRLRDVDEIAYLRFASVYKDFDAAADFERELAQLEAEIDSPT